MIALIAVCVLIVQIVTFLYLLHRLEEIEEFMGQIDDHVVETKGVFGSFYAAIPDEIAYGPDDEDEEERLPFEGHPPHNGEDGWDQIEDLKRVRATR
jgi:hypothetical protein